MGVARRAAFLAAGALWAGLGVLAILTVFGTILGLAMAWLTAVRRSVTAARTGAVLGVLMLLPGGLVLEVMGCRRDGCGAGAYLVAWGIPALVVGLNGIAGWGPGSRGAPSVPSVPGVPTDPPEAGLETGAGI